MHPTSYNTNLTSKQPGRANSGLNLKPGEWETLRFLNTTGTTHPDSGSGPVSSPLCLNICKLGRHGRLGMFALKVLLEGFGVGHLCLKGGGQ